MFIPVEELTPYALRDISEDEQTVLQTVFKDVPKENMLIVILGESSLKIIETIKNQYHDILNKPFVQSFSGAKTIVLIDPGFPIEESVKEIPVEDKQLQEANVKRIVVVKSRFPLTPVYGPHEDFDASLYVPQEVRNKAKHSNTLGYGQPNVWKEQVNLLRKKKTKLVGLYSAMRRFVFPRALSVLQTIVEHPAPVFLNSRITSVCYRSFKYILDVRKSLGFLTDVQYEYSREEPRTCNTEYPLFTKDPPGPFVKCSNQANINKYYRKWGFNEVRPNQKEFIEASIREMNQWANQEVQTYIPTPPPSVEAAKEGGKRKTRKRRRVNCRTTRSRGTSQ